MKALVLGLDCAAPALLFDRYADDLPVLSALRRRGAWGAMQSCDPPITVPAWTVMASSQDPGRLGIYGFRHRKPSTYTEGYTVSSTSITVPRIWDYLGQRGKNVIVVGVPPSYPPRPVRGCLVSCFMTPDGRPWTYPASLGEELRGLVGRYKADVLFRKDDRDRVLAETVDMTEQHFAILKQLLKTKPWDLAWFVEIGLDRIHHAFWKFFDPTHPGYVPGNKYERVGLEYYRLLDSRIGEILSLLNDQTAVLVISDHGAKAMRGAFCVNQWLAREGHLAFHEEPSTPIPLEQAPIDWSRTRAWGWGGYYARIFLNVRGREPSGVIASEDYERERDRLAASLAAVCDPSGRVMDTRVFKPERLYPVRRGDPPDLLVYFDDLSWRSAGTVGHPDMYLSENDTGPDDAVHDYDGIFILHDPRRASGGHGRLDILDVAPTVLTLMDEPVPPAMQGRPSEVVG
ncbi:MAG TPA: alkaline phosphatase family protein [bacterium]|nr:alkaline phosphatase family protein [bacterium]